MIGPVSGTGRAMMASLQQAMAKGMPADQAVQYVKSMATQGVAPLADLYAMMNQFQRLKQPQAQPPQTPPTIRDQLNMIDQQQQMQGGIGGMQAPAPQPMDRGLGAIDAGRMEYPQFAGGGVVALAGGGEPDLEAEVQRILKKSPMYRTSEENEILRAAGRTLTRRELPQDSAIARFDKFLGTPFIREMVALPYASEEELSAAKGTGAISERIARTLGAEQSIPAAQPPARTPAVTPSQSPVPPAVSPFANTPEGFGQMLAEAKKNVPQDMAPAPAASAMAAPRGRGGQDRYAELLKGVEGRKFEEIADKFSPEEEKRISKALSGLGAEKQDAVRMALAQAGFRMAAAASRGGRERTSFLGAAAEGAMGGMQQYAAVQKELRQTERELGKEMADLRKYQDQVARGERTAKRDFEEKKQRDILDLESKREQIRQFNAELGQRMQIAGMQYGDQGGQNEYRRSALTINMLDPMYKAAVEQLNKITEVPPVGIKPQSPEHNAVIAAAQKKVNKLEAEMRGAASGSFGGTPTVGVSDRYKALSDEAIRKALGI
jgi:hypothetical protein